MKNISKKFVIFFILVIFMISVFTVTCFADSQNGVFCSGDVIVFSESLVDNFAFIPGEMLLSFTSGGMAFEKINVTYRGYVVIEYYFLEDVYSTSLTKLEVFNSDGWISDEYRTICLNQSVVFDSTWLGFISTNSETTSEVSIYTLIFNLISSNIYGTTDLEGFDYLTVNFLAVALCLMAFVLPFVAVYIVLKFLIRVGDRLL